MNRPIVRLFGLVVLLFALLLAFTSRWTIFEASSLRDNTLNARCAARAAADRPRPDRRRRRHRARAQRARRRRHLRAQLPDRRRVRARRRLLLHEPRPSGPRALPQRDAQRPDRTPNLQTHPRPAAGQERRGRRRSSRRSTRRAQRVAIGRSAGTKARSSRSNRAPARSRVMASSPSYNPNALRSPRATNSSPTTPRARRSSTAPRSSATRRARRSRWSRRPPRSTPAPYTPNRRSAGATACTSPACRCRTTTTRASGRSPSPRRWPSRSTRSGRRSPNTSARRTMARYMKRFGFDRKPQLDYPAERDVLQRRVRPARG